MKKISFFLIFIIVLHNTGEAQLTLPDTTDPLMGNYILEGESELILQYAGEQAGQKRLIYNYTYGTNKFSNDFIEDKNNPNITNITSDLDMDVAVGDFNGDKIDDIVSAWECANGDSIFISIPVMTSRNLKWTDVKSITIGPLKIHTMVHFKDQNEVKIPSIKLISGNFDTDPQQEFIVSFYGKDEKLHLVLFETDSLLNIKKLDEINDYSLQDEYIYDIASGDFNRDGISEIILMNPSNEDYIESLKKYELSFKMKVYQCEKNKINSVLNPEITDLLKPIPEASYSIFPDVGKILNLDVTTGDLNADGVDEVIYGYVFEYKYTNVIQSQFTTSIIKYNTCFLINSFSIENNLTQVERITSDLPEIPNYTYIHVNTQMPMTVKTYDLDLDGTDEILIYACNFIEVYNLKENKLTMTCKNPVNFTIFSKSGRHMMVVGNFETNPNSATNLAPKIVVIDFDLSTLTLLNPTFDRNTGKVNGLQWSNNWKTYIPDGGKGLPYNSSYVVAIGDFNGDGMRLGKPIPYTKKKVFVPNIIMSAPPSHYDIFGNDTFNINNLWPKPDSHFEIGYTEYNNNKKETNVFSSTSTHDWGLSVQGDYGPKMGSKGITAKINAGYKGSYSKKNETEHTIIISMNEQSTLDDRIFGVQTDYFLYEYPVFVQGSEIGNFLFSIPFSNPGSKENKWLNSKDLNFCTYSPCHEFGNLLSYPSDIEKLPDYDPNGTFYTARTEGLGINKIPTNSYNASDITTELVNKSWEISSGFEIGYKGLIWSASVKGDYSYKKIKSYSTSLEDDFSFKYMFNKLNDKILGNSYEVTPCIYWSKSGALVIDYLVDLTGEWWETTYGQKPDLTFIMPYRYDQEKYKYINPVAAKSSNTSDIRYFPYDAKPGDTITIMATLRNFCLNDINTVTGVNVKFYLGDPDNGGEPIGDVDNNNSSDFTYHNIGPRGYDTKTFRWKSPQTIPVGNSFIFAVIDPDDAIKDEIHEDNNKGWIRLFNENGYPYTSTIPPKLDDLRLFIYPNPAHNLTNISFYLEKYQTLMLTIYNSVGQKMEQRLINNLTPGWQQIPLDISVYKPGIYIYDLTSINFRTMGKLIVD